MQIDLLYGKSGISVDLPNQWDITVINKPAMPLIQDVESTVSELLHFNELKKITNGCASACILVCDITRPVPNHTFLRPLIENLIRVGIRRDQITVLIATGLHRPNHGKELEAVIGDEWVLRNVRVTNHFALDDHAHVDLGLTSRGTPIKLDRRFIEADFKVATGLVEPHFMAGYSGGRKVVAPGIAHADTIRTFHSAKFMEDPLAVQCNVDGNPLHEEQLEIMDLVQEHTRSTIYAINTVIDDERQLSFINFGPIVDSHNAAIEHVHQYCTVAVERRFNTIISSAAGFPLDKTYYQTVKGMVTPMDLFHQNATLIVASDCSEGLGSDAYRQSQRNLLKEGPDNFLSRILTKKMADIDEWETEMQLKSQRIATIKLYSEGLQGLDRELTGVDLIDSIEKTAHESVVRSKSNAVAVIPEGPYVVPQYSPA